MANESTRTAIVTGSSRGIGAAVARRLAKDGFSVVVNYTGNAAEAESVVGDIKQGGGKALSIQADVSDPAAMRRMFDQAAAVSGGVDVLVNNAGIMQLAKISDADDAFFDRHIAINSQGRVQRHAGGGGQNAFEAAGGSSAFHPVLSGSITRPMEYMQPRRGALKQ